MTTDATYPCLFWVTVNYMQGWLVTAMVMNSKV